LCVNRKSSGPVTVRFKAASKDEWYISYPEYRIMEMDIKIKEKRDACINNKKTFPKEGF